MYYKGVTVVEFGTWRTGARGRGPSSAPSGPFFFSRIIAPPLISIHSTTVAQHTSWETLKENIATVHATNYLWPCWPVGWLLRLFYSSWCRQEAAIQPSVLHCTRRNAENE